MGRLMQPIMKEEPRCAPAPPSHQVAHVLFFNLTVVCHNTIEVGDTFCVIFDPLVLRWNLQESVADNFVCWKNQLFRYLVDPIAFIDAHYDCTGAYLTVAANEALGSKNHVVPAFRAVLAIALETQPL